MEIILKSGILEVTKIIKKTQAKMFKNLKVGDRIKLSIPVKHAGGGYRGTHASYIEIENINSGEVGYKSFNEITSILNRFELKLLEQDN